jgi:hypothetical protein
MKKWQQFEERRNKKNNGIGPRRPGTNAFIDSLGKEWRSLNYNDQPGYSEHQAADDQWREKKIGTPSIKTNIPSDINRL